MEKVYKFTNKELNTTAFVNISTNCAEYVYIITGSTDERDRCYDWMDGVKVGEVFENEKVKIEVKEI